MDHPTASKSVPQKCHVEENYLDTTLTENSNILVYVDTTTFATADEKPQNTEKPKSAKQQQKCVLRCKNIKVLHKIPQDEAIIELWRKKLKLKFLKKSHRLCQRHFTKTVIGNRIRLPTWVQPDSPEASESEDNCNEKNKEPNKIINTSNMWKVVRVTEEEEEEEGDKVKQLRTKKLSASKKSKKK